MRSVFDWHEGGRAVALDSEDVGIQGPSVRQRSPRGQAVFEWFARGSESKDSDAPDALSPRETEVIGLLAAGLLAKEAADRMKLSVKTVDNHRQNAMRKLGLRGRAELVLFAVRHGMVNPFF